MNSTQGIDQFAQLAADQQASTVLDKKQLTSLVGGGTAHGSIVEEGGGWLIIEEIEGF